MKRSGPAWVSGGARGYRPPPVTSGGEGQIPETRPEVLEKIRARIETTTYGEAFRQDYSNGEFTVSSLIIGRTFDAVKDAELELEVSGRVAYFDLKLGVWWRQGGSFD